MYARLPAVLPQLPSLALVTGVYQKQCVSFHMAAK